MLTMTNDGILNGENLLNRFSTALNTLVHHRLEPVFGADVDSVAFGPFTWADFGVTLCFGILALLLNGIAAGYIRYKSQKANTTPEAGPLLHDFLGALTKPLYTLIWIFGVYFAVTALLPRLEPGDELHVVREILDKVFNLGFFAVVFWFFFPFTHVLERQLTRWATKSDSKFAALLILQGGKSFRIIAAVVGVIFTLPILGLPPEYAGVLGKGTSIMLIVAVATIASQAVNLAEKAALTQFDIKAADNLRARKVYTQIHVISKLIYSAIALFTIASVLMLFDEVRQFGSSILASAGVLGIVLGVAAQKTISNLFAGFQIAITQPIRLDDVVVIEGEWGRVEEITLTFVIIHIWDDRRLVVPLGYFIEKPFQNWTRVSAQLLGSVVLWVDYTLPMDELRSALKKIIETHPLWDKRFWNVQVTDTTERTMQIRVLATSADSSRGWDLRCDIREKIITYIQQNHSESLPQFRTQISEEKSLLAPAPD